MKKIRAKICIVGSGFCGYTAYRKLKALNHKVILVEGGDIKTPKDQMEQRNYRVNVLDHVGHPKNQKVYTNLDPSFRDRKYTLGGSSECWTGFIKPFEESTYSNHYENMPDQHWGNINFRSYQETVLELLNSPIDNFEPEIISSRLNEKLPNLTQGLYYTTYASSSKTLRLKEYWIKRSTNDPNSIGFNTDVIYSYALQKAVWNKGKIKGLLFTNKKSNHINVEADYFILCLGGIENAKFMTSLLSEKNVLITDQKKHTMSFQEHPHFYNIASFDKGKKKLPKLLGRYEISRVNHDSFRPGYIWMAITAWDGPGTPKATFSISDRVAIFKKLTSNVKLKEHIKYTWLSLTGRRRGRFNIDMRCEQTPNTFSKIITDKSSTSLQWRITESDFHYYSRYLKRLASYLISNNYADNFKLKDTSIEGIAIPKEVQGGAHHMGTFPYLVKESIINRNFQSVDFKNLYVVGSSSFPISGFENPTHAAMCTSLIASEDIHKKINEV